MKIGLYSNNLNVGGIRTMVLALGSHLRNAGYETVVLSQQCDADPPLDIGDGLPLHVLCHSGWSTRFSQARRLANYVNQAGFDLIFLNIGTIRAAVRSLHWWSPTVTAVPILHNNGPWIYDQAKVNHSQWQVAVAVSPVVKAMTETHLPHKTIRTIANGIRIPPAACMATRAAWALPLQLLFVGRLKEEHKGILRLPAILAECRRQGLSVRLSVVGDGSDRERLELAFHQSGLRDSVTMMGAQPPAVVERAMQSHHILLMPSNYEGLPLVPIEAQANGCVPVVARLPGSTDVAVTDGATGFLVEPDDISSYVQRITALTAASRWQTLSRAARENAAANFSLDSMGKRYVELIQEIAGSAFPMPTAQRVDGHPSPFTRGDYLPDPVRAIAQHLRKKVQQWKRVKSG